MKLHSFHAQIFLQLSMLNWLTNCILRRKKDATTHEDWDALLRTEQHRIKQKADRRRKFQEELDQANVAAFARRKYSG
jgi:hypothetical protein